jgi:type II secretory pathway component PulF
MALIVTPSKLNQRAELYHQLGSAISAGIPLIRSFEMAASNPTVRASRRTVSEVMQRLRSGSTFTEALRHAEGWMPSFDMALLSAGEQSGRLDASFKLLSLYYSSRARIIRDTITGMLITLLTLHVFLLIFPLGYLIQFVQGLMNGKYAECIPFIVQKVVVFGALYGGVFLLIFACQGTRGEMWRSILEAITNMIPLLRTAIRYLAIGRLSAALEALIRSGVSIISSWQLAASASGSPALQRAVESWKIPLETGSTPAELVNQTSYFPQMFANLYSTGEHTGQLDDTLHRLHTYYQEEGFRWLKLFTRVFNGVLYGGIALLVAINVIRFWMNYFGGIMNGF